MEFEHIIGYCTCTGNILCCHNELSANTIITETLQYSCYGVRSICYLSFMNVANEVLLMSLKQTQITAFDNRLPWRQMSQS